jgi:hypothetical protein
VGKLTTSRRYNRLPLLRSSPGGFIRSWPYRTYPDAKVDIFSDSASVLFPFFQDKLQTLFVFRHLASDIFVNFFVQRRPEGEKFGRFRQIQQMKDATSVKLCYFCNLYHGLF